METIVNMRPKQHATNGSLFVIEELYLCATCRVGGGHIQTDGCMSVGNLTPLHPRDRTTNPL